MAGRTHRGLVPTPDRGPLRIAFLLTSMPVGGAETLLVELVRRLDRERFLPEIICLKHLDVLGIAMADEVPVASRFLSGKYDLRVLPRLARHLRSRRIDAVVTVGSGDKMFWGRLAARCARTPVVVSALHSTGWPDGISRLNRLLTRWTDAFVAVAPAHGEFLVSQERLPAGKVRVVPNGIDTQRFQADDVLAQAVRQELRIPLDAPVCGIVAALRPEKNHALFLRVAQKIRDRFPDAHFLIVGDGPRRAALEALTDELQLRESVRFLGTRTDTPAVLNALNVFLLTSQNEANPVSVLEALAVEVPVVATRVGSLPATVVDDRTGYLADPEDVDGLATHACRLLGDPSLASRLGRGGRELVVGGWSVDRMVEGYEDLITNIYDGKAGRRGTGPAVETSTPQAEPQSAPVA